MSVSAVPLNNSITYCLVQSPPLAPVQSSRPSGTSRTQKACSKRLSSSIDCLPLLPPAHLVCVCLCPAFHAERAEVDRTVPSAAARVRRFGRVVLFAPLRTFHKLVSKMSSYLCAVELVLDLLRGWRIYVVEESRDSLSFNQRSRQRGCSQDATPWTERFAGLDLRTIKESAIWAGAGNGSELTLSEGVIVDVTEWKCALRSKSGKV